MKNSVVLILVILLLEGCNLFSPDEKEEFCVVVVEADSGVTVLPQKTTVHLGEQVTFTYILKEGYKLDNIIVNGVSIIPSDNSFSVIADSPELTVRITTKQELIISAIAGPNGSIDPSGDVVVIEGEDKTFWISPNAGFLTDTLRIDGQEIALSTSYTFSNVTSNKKIEVTFKKDSILWPLLNIEWSRDSLYVDNNKHYQPEKEILNFYPGGNYTKFWNGKLYERTGWAGWAVDKTQNPVILTYEGRSCKIEKISEEKLVFSYINEINQKVTHVYSAKRYK